MAEKGFFYTNGAAIGASVVDFTFIFQRRSLPAGATPTPGQIQTGIAGELDVVTSPQHAKTFSLALIDAILNYEQQHGPIPMTPEDIKKYGHLLERLPAKPRSQ